MLDVCTAPRSSSSSSLLARPAAAADSLAVAYRAVPKIASDVRLSGTVVVEALVDSTGAVVATGIARSIPALDDAAAARVRAQRFPPLRHAGGDAVASLRTVPVVFETPPGNEPADAWAHERCEETSFAVDLDVRPDSLGRFEARWSAKGLKTQELYVIVLVPDGAVLDTTGQGVPAAARRRPDGARVDRVARPGPRRAARRRGHDLLHHARVAVVEPRPGGGAGALPRRLRQPHGAAPEGVAHRSRRGGAAARGRSRHACVRGRAVARRIVRWRSIRKDDRYEAAVPGGTAFIEYRLKPGRIVLVHTEVPKESEGHGVGDRLVRFALDDARARGLAVVPLCPFVAAWIERHPDYRDLVRASD